MSETTKITSCFVNRKDAIKLGEWLTIGAFQYVTVFAAVVAAFAIIVTLISAPDSTDKSRWERSGLTVLTDYGTGKEYIKSGCAMIERAK